MQNSQKNIYKFTLILSGVDEHTQNLEDSLYESNCDDALINFRNGTVFLDFVRESTSLEEAIIGAIKDVESSSVNAQVSSVEPENFVTESDIAKRLGTTRQSVSLWVKGSRRINKPFPNPVMKLSERSPFWKWSEVVSWLYSENIIDDKNLVKNSIFLEDLNIILNQRQIQKIRKLPKNLVNKFAKKDSHYPVNSKAS
jgi:hypothetical protein